MKSSPRLKTVIKLFKSSLITFIVISPIVVFAGSESITLDSVLEPVKLDPIEIIADKVASPINGTQINQHDISTLQSSSSDSTRLLENIPGISVYEAGAISGLPVIHGLADDRLRVQVDGMDLMSACPNHMNSALSFIHPSKVGSITTFAGITPVSVGGDSIGGTIQVKSAPPRFADTGGKLLFEGRMGTFFRSNNHARGYNLNAEVANQNVNLSYSESRVNADNYTAGKDFKSASLWSGPLQNGLSPTDANEVASSSLKDSINQDVGIALKHEGHLLQFNISEQSVGFEGFPNQRMDMTYNKNALFNLRYTGQFDWGDIEARLYQQYIRHKMEMSFERVYALPAMPMDSKARTSGGQIKAIMAFPERDIFRIGGEFQNYSLDDWWPPVGSSVGSMCCNEFWNIQDGKRNRIGIFGEWEAVWNSQWLSLLGIRNDNVETNAGLAQGYSNGSYKSDADKFNALNHARKDSNIDWTGLIRYTPEATETFELGLAQKTRSPNLYERYPWSTFAMAALMNNFVGDGNAYIGNPNLKSEIAHTLSASADWHDAERQIWGLKVTGYLTYVDDFIDAKRCNLVGCGATNPTKTNAYVLLQYENQSAKLYGVDVSAYQALGSIEGVGSFTTNAIVNYVKGANLTTGDNLYHIMPLNTKVKLIHQLGTWTNTAELQMVSAKSHISHVRNEVPTEGYTLLNLRTSYAFKQARFDLSVENLLNKYYNLPLGGAYVGQGASMTTNIIPWGVTVPGMGRSFNVAFTLDF
ncbi:MAG: TonB-dependent receptor [Methylophilus sp.]|nr:TonB-dependent receptor [Methylophilus sp.]